MADQFEQDLAATLGFEVEGDAALATVHRPEGIIPVARRLAHHVALRRLDFDHIGSGEGEQESGIGTIEQPPEIEHAKAGQRQIFGIRSRHVVHLVSPQKFVIVSSAVRLNSGAAQC